MEYTALTPTSSAEAKSPPYEPMAKPSQNDGMSARTGSLPVRSRSPEKTPATCIVPVRVIAATKPLPTTSGCMLAMYMLLEASRASHAAGIGTAGPGVGAGGGRGAGGAHGTVPPRITAATSPWLVRLPAVEQ